MRFSTVIVLFRSKRFFNLFLLIGYILFYYIFRNMGNICTSKQSSNLAAGVKVPTGSQYNLDGTTTNPEELKYFTAGKQY